MIVGCHALKSSDQTPYGGVMIVIRENSLRQFYQSFLNKSTNIMLLIETGTVLSSNITSEIGQRFLEAARENETKVSPYLQTYQDEIILSDLVIAISSCIHTLIWFTPRLPQV